METIAGKMAGTEADEGKAPLIRKNEKELDCIDETINTTQFLRLLEQNNLLKFHQAGRPAYKGYFINGVYPHNTATLIETQTQEIFAIDSFIHPNGQEPVIKKLSDWKTSISGITGAD